ncbi:MAG: FadR/GntR family transcriptional regulator [Sphingomonas sp.]|uniref:FadR/GntR family transcriptional regulator n=1 Tax=Sphingomonas sp. TaxID=28214 RepID=UPI003F815090
MTISDEAINAARGMTPLHMPSTTRIARAIAMDIFGGVLKPGDRIPGEEESLERFGVSRTVWREAIKILDAKGLVTPKPKVGTRVRDRQSWNFLDPEVLAWRISVGLDADLLQTLREARLAVEPFAARLSATRASLSDLTEMETSVRLMDAAVGDRTLFAEADLRFHRAVAASTGNFVLGSFSAVIEIALVCATLLLPLEDESLRSEAVRRHADLFDAIVNHDGDRASRLMTDMIAFGGEVGELSSEPDRARPGPI